MIISAWIIRILNFSSMNRAYFKAARDEGEIYDMGGEPWVFMQWKI